MKQSLVDQLFDYAAKHHPRACKGMREARLTGAERFEEMTEQLLTWALGVLGDRLFETTLGAFERFSEGVIYAQARYEKTGAYANKSFAEVEASLYSQRNEMDDYLWGVYLTNVLWAHHMNLSTFYDDNFVSRLPAAATIVELAPGHGGWGLWALHRRPDATLTGYDISPSSIEIASGLAKSAGFETRSRYVQCDVLDLERTPGGLADACVCNFLVEHLEHPEALVNTISHLLKPGATAFFSGALTAAQVDHIYEFRQESELVRLVEMAGLRALETVSVGPQRTLPKARFLPRSMSLIVQKPANLSAPHGR